MVKTTSHAAAPISCTELATSASPLLSAVRWATASGFVSCAKTETIGPSFPCLVKRFLHIGRPMLPRPTNPILTFLVLTGVPPLLQYPAMQHLIFLAAVGLWGRRNSGSAERGAPARPKEFIDGIISMRDDADVEKRAILR